MDRFNLVNHAWIRAVVSSGRVFSFSLRDVFMKAHEIVDIAESIPIRWGGVMNLLLAITHIASRNQSSGKYLEPSKFIGVLDYLNEHSHQFYLISETNPFFQVASKNFSEKDQIDRIVPIQRLTLVNAAGQNTVMFDPEHCMNNMSLNLEPDEAARVLLAFMAYTPAMGSSTPDSTKKSFGIVGAHHYLIGRTLAETLRLNTPFGEHASNDLPLWERSMPSTIDGLHRPANGPVDMLTWGSRRILLSGDNGAISNAVVRQGYTKKDVKDNPVQHPLHAHYDRGNGVATWQFVTGSSRWDPIQHVLSCEHGPHAYRALVEASLEQHDTIKKLIPNRIGIRTIGIDADNSKIVRFNSSEVELDSKILIDASSTDAFTTMLSQANETAFMMKLACATARKVYASSTSRSDRQSNVMSGLNRLVVDNYWPLVDSKLDEMAINPDNGIDWLGFLNECATSAWKAAWRNIGYTARGMKSLVIGKSFFDKKFKAFLEKELESASAGVCQTEEVV